MRPVLVDTSMVVCITRTAPRLLLVMTLAVAPYLYPGLGTGTGARPETQGVLHRLYSFETPGTPLKSVARRRWNAVVAFEIRLNRPKAGLVLCG